MSAKSVRKVAILFLSVFVLGLFIFEGVAGAKAKTPYLANVFKETRENSNFRKVLFTGDKSQLVVMSIPPGGEIGEENHKHVEQTLFFLSGNGKAIINGVEHPIGEGTVVVVPPANTHNFLNTGKKPLKVFTTYSPPNHIDGRIQATKADADADTEDEEFGEKVR